MKLALDTAAHRKNTVNEQRFWETMELAKRENMVNSNGILTNKEQFMSLGDIK